MTIPRTKGALYGNLLTLYWAVLNTALQMGIVLHTIVLTTVPTKGIAIYMYILKESSNAYSEKFATKA